MTITSVKQNDLEKIKEIYEEAFPENERITFDNLVKEMFPNSKLFGAYDNNELVGMCYLSLTEEFCYLVYIAVDKDKRNKGGGAKILDLIKKKFKKPIVICVEQPTSELRKRRIEFYKRKGFKIANFQFDYLNEKYLIMQCGRLNIDKFIDFLLICFPGCSNFKVIEI